MVEALVIDTRYGTHFGIKANEDGQIVQAVEINHNYVDKFKNDSANREHWAWSEDLARRVQTDVAKREREFQLELL
jgi:hypothetical protein